MKIDYVHNHATAFTMIIIKLIFITLCYSKMQLNPKAMIAVVWYSVQEVRYNADLIINIYCIYLYDILSTCYC